MIYNINLPQPNQALLDYMFEFSNSVYSKGLPKRTQEESDRIFPLYPGKNICSNPYTMNLVLSNLFYKQYRSFFSTKTTPIVIAHVNINPSTPAEIMPHTDSQRRVAFNFIADPGGSNVKNQMYYNYYDQEDISLVDTIQFSHEESKLEGVYTLEHNHWYGLNVRYSHGVTNIETKRLLLGISIFEGIDSLMKTHPHLFGERLVSELVPAEGIEPSQER